MIQSAQLSNNSNKETEPQRGKGICLRSQLVSGEFVISPDDLTQPILLASLLRSFPKLVMYCRYCCSVLLFILYVGNINTLEISS